MRRVVRHTDDKPWIADEFRRFIRYRGMHLIETECYIDGSIAKLIECLNCGKYFTLNVQNLCTSDLYNWWRETKRLAGQTSRTLIADRVYSNLLSLRNTSAYDTAVVSAKYFKHPTNVFCKLSNFKTLTSSGPNGVSNWFCDTLHSLYQKLYAKFSTLCSYKESCI